MAPPLPLPSLFGRSGFDGNVDVRSCTHFKALCVSDFCSGAIGSASAELRQSGDSEDRGGFSLSLEIQDDSCSFLPYAETTGRGVVLHIAGAAEAEALAVAILEVLTRRRKGTTPDSVRILLRDPGV